jgi:hypothetical protein
MAYVPSEAERTVSRMMEEVERVMGKDFAGELPNAHCDELSEYEDRAVYNHGRSILAAIDGTTYAMPGSRSSRSRSDSPLVRLLEVGVGEVSA